MNFLDSCRFCIQEVNKNERIEITYSHRSKFKDLTNTELINSEFYSKFSCFDCLKKLDSCLEVKNEFISKQDYLLNTCHQSVGGILQDQFVDTKDFSSYPTSIESVVKIEQDDYEFIDMEEAMSIEVKSERLSPIEHFKTEGSADKEVVSKHPKKHKKPRPAQKKKETTATTTSSDVAECPYCFKLVQNLKSHQQKSHKNEVAKKKIDSKKNLEKQKLPCHICGQMLSAAQIQLHLNTIHRKLRRYVCDYCKRKFFTKKAVLAHFSVHVKVDPVQCLVCFRFYKSEKYLKHHMKWMHSEKTFVCDFLTNGVKCGKQFESVSKLRRHSNIYHRWINRFSCKHPDCEQSYLDPRDLECHEFIIHLNMKIKCDLCPTLVTTKRYYKRHINIHHKELDENARKFILDKITKSDLKSLFNYHMASADNHNLPGRKRKSCDFR